MVDDGSARSRDGGDGITAYAWGPSPHIVPVKSVQLCGCQRPSSRAVTRNEAGGGRLPGAGAGPGM